AGRGGHGERMVVADRPSRRLTRTPDPDTPRARVAAMTDRSADWAARRRAWETERLAPALERAPERRTRISTISDATIERLYGPWSLPEADLLDTVGFPGEPPFTRGIHPTGYRSRR